LIKDFGLMKKQQHWLLLSSSYSASFLLLSGLLGPRPRRMSAKTEM